MQKVVEFLERHVQWLALGLGVVWMLYMVYAYVLTPPAVVEVNGTKLLAGQVDQYAVDNAAKQLEQAMATPPEMPEMHVQKFAEAWQAKMGWSGATPVTTPQLVFSPPVFSDAQFPDTTVPGPEGILPVAGRDATKIGDMPKGNIPGPLAKATPSDARFGRSTAMQPPAPPPVAQPGQFQPPPAQPALAQEVDKDWVTQSFKISIPAIAEAFKAAQVPQPIFRTAFLKLEVVRQELMPNGQWGNEVILQPLNNGVLRQPWPAPKAGKGADTAYFNWAVANSGDIVQPAFYQTVLNKGDMWTRPGPKGDPQVAAQQWVLGQFKGDLAQLKKENPEMWEAEMKARRENALRRKQERRAAPRRGRGAPDEGMMDDPSLQAPRDTARPQFYQVQPRRGYPPPGYDPALMDPAMDPSMMDPSMMEGEMGTVQQPLVPAAGIPNIDYPQGEFDPSTWAVPVPGAPPPQPNMPQQTPEIDVWAHDETVQPGKTYRYKLRYFIKNPLWQAAPALLKNKKDADQFFIVSPDSDWSSNVEVPPLTNFFIASGNAGVLPRKLKFEVFRWKGGVQHSMTQEAGPGDVLGKAQEAADFTTGHTIVDIRLDAKTREPIVILTNDKGETIVRSSKVDYHSALRKKLADEAKAAQVPVAAATGR